MMVYEHLRIRGEVARNATNYCRLQTCH